MPTKDHELAESDGISVPEVALRLYLGPHYSWDPAHLVVFPPQSQYRSDLWLKFRPGTAIIKMRADSSVGNHKGPGEGRGQENRNRCFFYF